MQDNTLNDYSLILILQNLFHNHISHLVLTPLHYILLTAYLSGNLLSEVLIPTFGHAHVRLPEIFTAEHSRPPTPVFADYPIRVDSIAIYDPKDDPRFPVLSECFSITNDLFSYERRETEVKRLQNSKLESQFEVKVRFQGLNPHPVFHIAKKEHKTTPVPFEVTFIDFNRNPQLNSKWQNCIIHFRI